MTITREIQDTICKSEIKKGNLVAENFNYFYTGELDVISINKSEYVAEFEVKVSRSDFKADAKKRKWFYFDNQIKKHIPNYFTYVCPKGLIMEEDLKPYMGLIWYIEGDLIIIRKPKLIHREKQSIVSLLKKVCRVNNWKHYFGVQQLTILAREAKARNKEESFKEKVKHINKQRK